MWAGKRAAEVVRTPRSPSPELRRLEREVDKMRGVKDTPPAKLKQVEEQLKRLRVKESERELVQMRDELEKLRKERDVTPLALQQAEEAFRGAESIMADIRTADVVRRGDRETKSKKR